MCTRERRESTAHELERKAILHGLEMMRAGKPVADIDTYLISACAVAEAVRTGETEES